MLAQEISMEKNTKRDTSEKNPCADSLARFIMDEILLYLCLQQHNMLRKLISLIGITPSTWLAEILACYEKRIVESSFLQASREALVLFSDGIKVNGKERIPEQGALLIIANHPGLVDALGALVIAGRENVKIVAGKRDFLRILPNLRRHFLELDTDVNLRASATREIIRLLNQGETVLIFPRGLLEPDPGLRPGTLESLQEWSRSIGIFLAKSPKAHLVPMLISQILTEKAWNSWLALRFKSPKRRHQMAMLVQFVMQRISKNPIWKIPMRIDVGEAKTAHELDPELNAKNLAELAKNQMDSLVRMVYPDNHE
jgi:putative hemolysin